MIKATALLLATLVLAACGKTEPTEQAKPANKAGKTEKTAPRATTQRTAEEALRLGLEWLKGQQKGGIWFTEFDGKPVPNPALTAMAIAPIAISLPAEARKDDPLVKQAVGFLLKAQREDGGVDTGGMSKYDNYFTSAALMALAAVGDPAHEKARDRMRDFLLTLQRMEEGRTKGGFGYNTAGGADLSNAQFAIESLRTAGIPEDHPAMKRARAFLERAQNRSENEANKGAAYEFEDEKLGKHKVVPGDDGSAGYEPGVSKAGMRRLPDGTYVPRGYGSMTYALLKCYLLVGLKPDDARVQGAVDWLSKNYGWDENPGFEDIAKELNQPEAPYWGLYYYYMTAAKALRLLGVDKLDTPDGTRDWRKDLADAIVRRQREDGSWFNSKSPRWQEGDPVLTTSYACVALQEILGRK